MNVDCRVHGRVKRERYGVFRLTATALADSSVQPLTDGFPIDGVDSIILILYTMTHISFRYKSERESYAMITDLQRRIIVRRTRIR